MRKTVLNILGVPLVSIGLFAFQCSDPQFYVSELIWSFIISIVLWLGNSWLIKGLNKYIPWRKTAFPRLFIQFGLSVLFTIWFTYFAVKFLYAGVYDAHFSSLVFRANLFVFLTISLLYNALHTGKHFFQQWRNSIIEAEEWKRQNLISQNEALANQINPHFLFNSINTMIGLVEDHPKLAIGFGHQLADIYRQILDKGKRSLITLKEELDIVDIQCNLFKIRFGDGLKIERNIPAAFLSLLLPPLALQHLIENAIKHNQISDDHPLTITMDIVDDYIAITNNIQPKNFRLNSTTVGLENIKKRYEFLTNRAVMILEEEDTFSVRLPLIDPQLP